MNKTTLKEVKEKYPKAKFQNQIFRGGVLVSDELGKTLASYRYERGYDLNDNTILTQEEN